ncbi:MAG: hypothetical protein HOV71_13975 [Hamadaea sp.]|nr:hypothetical protein [Hamadaea sp.]NUT05341.1 hypothetical protein [Hamadaea sp.]
MYRPSASGCVAVPSACQRPPATCAEKLTVAVGDALPTVALTLAMVGTFAPSPGELTVIVGVPDTAPT